MREAMFYEKIDDGTVKCLLCPVGCVMTDGQRSFCRVREPVDGKLYTLVYELICSAHVDPIEKKPFYRYHPGEFILSLGTRGCNLHCDFCQNWHISQGFDGPTQNITSDEVIKRAKELNSFGIAYTYNDVPMELRRGLYTTETHHYQNQLN